MRICLVALCVILCAIYAHSESWQYYPGVGYVTTGKRPVQATSARLRAVPGRNQRTNQRTNQRSRAARLREEYELIEREELAPARRRSRPVYRNTNRRSSSRRSSSNRRYRFARNEATTVSPVQAPAPASEPVAVPVPQQPQSSSSSSSSFGSSPARTFGGFFPNFQGGVTGGGFAQTNGPGTAFATGFAHSSGSNSFAGGFGAVINHPQLPKFAGPGQPAIVNKGSNNNVPSSKSDSGSDDSGFDDPISPDDSVFVFMVLVLIPCFPDLFTISLIHYKSINTVAKH